MSLVLEEEDEAALNMYLLNCVSQGYQSAQSVRRLLECCPTTCLLNSLYYTLAVVQLANLPGTVDYLVDLAGAILSKVQIVLGPNTGGTSYYELSKSY